MGEAPKLQVLVTTSLVESTSRIGECTVDGMTTTYNNDLLLERDPLLGQHASLDLRLELIEAIPPSFLAIRRMIEDVDQGDARCKVLIIPEAQQSGEPAATWPAEGSAIANATGSLTHEKEAGHGGGVTLLGIRSCCPSLRRALTRISEPRNSHSSVWSLGLLQ